MKLSEKLAALEDRAEPRPPRLAAAPRATARKAATARRPSRTPRPRGKQSKRKVRDLVLAELAPRMAGLDGDALADEVKACLDGILTREDVKVSPVERRRFVEEVMQDTLGYGPLDPLLADETVTEIMCNAFDEIWVERGGKLEHDARFVRRRPPRTARSSTASSVASVVASTKARRWSTPASPTAPASTPSSRRSPCTAPCSRSASSPPTRSR